MRKLKGLFAGSIAVSLLLSSCREELSCTQFKNGEFKLSANSEIRILREGDTQKEYSNNPNEDFIDVYKINWLDECTYSATLHETNKESGHELSKGDSMLVRIVKTSDKRYEWEGHVKGDIKKGIMIKLN